MSFSGHAAELLALIDARAREVVYGALQFKVAELVSWNAGAEPPTATFKTLPDGLATHDLPVSPGWAGSPGYVSGALGGPEPGTLALLASLDPAGEHMVCIAFLGSTTNALPPVPAGEYWVFHKSGSYAKLSNDSKVKFYSGTEIDLVAPLIQLSDSLDALGAGTEVVRKSDLQALISWINSSLLPWVRSHAHIGNLGSPTSNAVTALLLLDASGATASGIAKAK